MRMLLPSDCNAHIHTLRVDCKQAVSLSQLAMILSQPLCTYHNKRITYVVHSWYMGAHSNFFNSCLAIVTIGFCSVSLTRMHWHPVPQKINQSYTKNYDTLVYNLAANVPNMLATCCNDTRFRSNFGQMGRCCRHKIEDVGTFCVGLSRHPYFPPKTSPAQVHV